MTMIVKILPGIWKYENINNKWVSGNKTSSIKNKVPIKYFFRKCEQMNIICRWTALALA